MIQAMFNRGAASSGNMNRFASMLGNMSGGRDMGVLGGGSILDKLMARGGNTLQKFIGHTGGGIFQKLLSKPVGSRWNNFLSGQGQAGSALGAAATGQAPDVSESFIDSILEGESGFSDVSPEMAPAVGQAFQAMATRAPQMTIMDAVRAFDPPHATSIIQLLKKRGFKLDELLSSLFGGAIGRR